MLKFYRPEFLIDPKHTPVPWRKGRLGMGSTVFSAEKKTLGKVYHENQFHDPRKDSSRDIPIDEGMANLDLIIAAPDLLSVCRSEVVMLANLAALVDPQQANEYMSAVYDAIGRAIGKRG